MLKDYRIIENGPQINEIRAFENGSSTLLFYSQNFVIAKFVENLVEVINIELENNIWSESSSLPLYFKTSKLKISLFLIAYESF